MFVCVCVCVCVCPLKNCPCSVAAFGAGGRRDSVTCINVRRIKSKGVELKYNCHKLLSKRILL